MPFHATVRNNLLNAALRNAGYTGAAALYMSLHSANPTDSGSNEIAGGSYIRKAIAFDAASAGHTQNTGAVAFTGMPTAATISHFGIWTADTGGTLIGYGALTANKSTSAGDTLNFAIGEVDWDLT